MLALKILSRPWRTSWGNASEVRGEDHTLRRLDVLRQPLSDDVAGFVRQALAPGKGAGLLV